MHYLLWQLVDQSARHYPESAAIRCRGESLTYRELAERSNQLAHLLVERGVRTGDRVGILMNKRPECAVAIYGIMKAGGAYVPLDPAAPTERHVFVAHDCDISHIISEPRKQNAVAKLAAARPLGTVIGCTVEGCKPVSFDSLDAYEHRTPPPVHGMEQDLAYVLYTSGSTGVPKGIMHSHRSALAWAEVAAEAYSLGHTDRISNYAPLHFDLSTLDYFAGALVGATTVMIPEDVAKIPASLAQLVADEAMTVFYTVPLALTQLALSGGFFRHDFSRLKWVLFGGEQMPPKHLATLMEQLPQATFCNVYGPTETNGCTHFVIGRASNYDQPVPIGQPYANVEALVLDTEDQPVEPGETGELVIRAATLMRGYWAREDLNAVCSYYRKSGAGLPDRFHRTGDLVYALEDGNLQFVGRKDRQIKSRGCRVDLDEVEAILLGFEQVSEAAVYPAADEHGHQLIEAVVIPVNNKNKEIQQNNTLTGAFLRSLLRKVLPPYAVPVQIGIRFTLPRTSTGKIDRLLLANEATARRSESEKTNQ